MEGPFLNPKKKGAHNPAYLRLPDLDAVRDWSPETGIRLVTLAPELPGALELVEVLSKRGVLVSAGHSMATFAEATAGFDAGCAMEHISSTPCHPWSIASPACPAHC